LYNHQCSVCDYIYNKKDEKGVDFDSLPADWRCPGCGSHKSSFIRIKEEEKKKIK
jgi:rubredoxin